MKNINLRQLGATKKVHESGRQLTLLDERAKRLLEVIALSYAQSRPLTVAAAMALVPSTSSSTPHR
jgi:hypothetical protein